MRAFAYGRYSSNNQREESIDAQLRAIYEFVAKNNYTIVAEYIDEAKSATSDDRPAFLQMIDDAKNEMCDVIIVHKLDRFSRNKYDSALYKRELKEHGIKLISVLENLDDSPESIILESVLEGMAEYYSQNLAREVKKGLKENALECKHTGGKPPFGYDVDDTKHYIINPHEAKAAKYIFESAASGLTSGQIIKWLKANYYTTKYGTSFTPASINAIIRNEKYKGVYTYGKYKRIRQNGKKRNVKGENSIVIEDGIPKIVDIETWQKANDVFDSRRYTAGGQGKAKETYLLSGLIQCGSCGAGMSGCRVNPGGNRSMRVLYKCNNRKAKKECTAKDIRKDLVEATVIEELDKVLSVTGVEKLIDDLFVEVKKQVKEIPDEITLARKQLADITSKIDTMINAIMDGLYSSSMKEKMNALETQKEFLTDKINYLESRNTLVNMPSKEYLAEKLRKDLDIKQKSPDEQKRIIRTYVQKVVVFPEHIDIKFVVDTTSGAEGNRTPVRKPIH